MFDFRITADHQSDNGFVNVSDNRGLDFATLRADWQLRPIDSVMLQAGVTNRHEWRRHGDSRPTRCGTPVSRPATPS